MGKAFAKIAVFALIILVSCALINWVLIPSNPRAYQAAKLDKVKLLEQTASWPSTRQI